MHTGYAEQGVKGAGSFLASGQQLSSSERPVVVFYF